MDIAAKAGRGRKRICHEGAKSHKEWLATKAQRHEGTKARRHKGTKGHEEFLATKAQRHEERFSRKPACERAKKKNSNHK